MVVNGWKLVFHPCLVAQARRLVALGTEEGRRNATDPDPDREAYRLLLAALSHAIYVAVPRDPGAPEFRLSADFGPGLGKWRRVRFAGRFRLFFRYDSRARVIFYAVGA